VQCGKGMNKVGEEHEVFLDTQAVLIMALNFAQ